jgi:alkylation response protein AidB-like acyl-CoA dehydrogenase
VSINLAELIEAARKAFPADRLAPDRNQGWTLAAEMGWLMVRVPEADGGLGLGIDASTAIHYEMGGVLSRLPLIPAQLALQAIAGSRIADREGWIERLIGGEYVPLHLLPARVTATDGRISGTVSGVLEADIASHVLTALPGCYALVPLDALGVAVVERSTWDETRRLFDLVLDGFRVDPALVLAEGEAARSLHDRLSPETHLALAADCLGGASAALAASVAYLGTRQQFDRPLAMFQALKHRCADLKKEIALGDALLWQRAGEPVPERIAAGGLKAFATRVYRDVAEEAIQLHGGIGLTVEHPCHLFLKRAFLNAALCGDTDYWNEAVGRLALTRADA